MHKTMSRTICGMFENAKTKKPAIANMKYWFSSLFLSRTLAFFKFTDFFTDYYANIVFHWLLKQFTDFSLNLKKIFFRWAFLDHWRHCGCHYGRITLKFYKHLGKRLPRYLSNFRAIETWNLETFFNWKITCAGPLGHEHSDITI